jgi:F-type H+-transporting ATPase subunit b
MRLALLLLAFAPSVARAAEEAAGPVNLLAPKAGLMFWTLIIFGTSALILARFAFGPITRAVRDREAALQAAMDAARADREAAQALLAEQKAALDAARAEAQQMVTDARAAAERLRAELTEQAKAEQQAMLERARTELAAEKNAAIAELRREAVDLAIAGAGKVIEKNLDDATNRSLVEAFLASVGSRR